jgi:hypothetical protein
MICCDPDRLSTFDETAENAIRFLSMADGFARRCGGQSTITSQDREKFPGPAGQARKRNVFPMRKTGRET